MAPRRPRQTGKKKRHGGKPTPQGIRKPQGHGSHPKTTADTSKSAKVSRPADLTQNVSVNFKNGEEVKFTIRIPKYNKDFRKFLKQVTFRIFVKALDDLNDSMVDAPMMHQLWYAELDRRCRKVRGIPAPVKLGMLQKAYFQIIEVGGWKARFYWVKKQREVLEKKGIRLNIEDDFMYNPIAAFADPTGEVRSGLSIFGDQVDKPERLQRDKEKEERDLEYAHEMQEALEAVAKFYKDSAAQGIGYPQKNPGEFEDDILDAEDLNYLEKLTDEKPVLKRLIAATVTVEDNDYFDYDGAIDEEGELNGFSDSEDEGKEMQVDAN